MNICNRENRPRPVLITPAKGAEGDCTDETMASMCDINRIIQRYGGNLAELAAWRGSMSFGEQPPDNLEDALERLNDAKKICHSLGVETLKEALDKLTPEVPDNTELPDNPVNNSVIPETLKKDEINEKTKDQSQNV